MADRNRPIAVLHQNRISGRTTTPNTLPMDDNRVEPEVTFEALADRLPDNELGTMDSSRPIDRE